MSWSQGDVNGARFILKFKDIDYGGPLSIEYEIPTRNYKRRAYLSLRNS
jgi:sugar phosphate isomerase/epimerase